MKKYWLTIVFFLNVGMLYATHQKAAEITYQHLEGYTYRFTIVTYTFIESLADRPSLYIRWGYQNKETEVPRIWPLPPNPNKDTRENRYVVDHTFPGPGTYYISMEDPNRNGSVINMPNSINTPMYVESKLIISPFVSLGNSSPELLNKPIDAGCLGIPFMHNPGAFDVDGDSLSYKLVNCRGAEGLDIPGYALPRAQKSLTIDPVTGDLLWDSPIDIGEFNLAILIEEYRMGVAIGSVMRDMQITIQVCNNRPPELDVQEKICVFAGDTLIVPVLATDPDTTDILTLSATGGIFLLSRNGATFPAKTGLSPLLDTLIWTPQHEHVQNNPYPVYFKAKDNGDPNLNALKTLLVQVIGRAPEWDSLTSTFTTISLGWTPILDTSVFGYQIFRAQSRSGQVAGSCDFGLTDTAYELLAELKNKTIYSFVDTTVMRSMSYCYRILTVYKNGTKSQMSDEICGGLLSNTPILEKVSVVETDLYNGKIDLAWRKPLDFDVTSNETNFRYVVHRSLGTDNFSAIDTIQGDTTFADKGLNTLENYYHYKIELIQQEAGNRISIGFSDAATSVFAHATGKNKRVNVQWQFSQPWKAEGFAIYRKLTWQSDFDSVFYTNLTYFTDTSVMNDSSYTYKVKAFGRHYNERIKDYVLVNWSQETQAIPQIDTPCRQKLVLDFTECKPARNGLSWMPMEDCFDENPTYHLFYKPSKNEPFKELLQQSESAFIHKNMQSNVGCYYVIASNIKGLYSMPSDTVCIDFQHCMQYELPNVFTPNGDGINDIFKALPNEYSGTFRIKIFNRWGNIVFESKESDFEWDGTHHTMKQPCPDGTYFYVAELILQGLEHPHKETLSGYITLIR